MCIRDRYIRLILLHSISTSAYKNLNPVFDNRPLLYYQPIGRHIESAINHFYIESEVWCDSLLKMIGHTTQLTSFLGPDSWSIDGPVFTYSNGEISGSINICHCDDEFFKQMIEGFDFMVSNLISPSVDIDLVSVLPEIRNTFIQFEKLQRSLTSSKALKEP